MKNAALFVLLMLSNPALAAPGQDEYSINIHVTSSFFLFAGGTAGQELNVIIDGKKYELSGLTAGPLLALGDYKAKLIKDEHKTSYESIQVYEILFPDKKTRKFTVVGQTE
jgi:hypothetical protein